MCEHNNHCNSEENTWEETWLRVNQKYKDLDQTTFIINGGLASWINEGTECFKTLSTSGTG